MPREESDKGKMERWKLSQNSYNKAHDENKSFLKCSNAKLVITEAPPKQELSGSKTRVGGEVR